MKISDITAEDIKHLTNIVNDSEYCPPGPCQDCILDLLAIEDRYRHCGMAAKKVLKAYKEYVDNEIIDKILLESK